jgi:hypothetical protein
VAEHGDRHDVSVTPGNMAAPVCGASTKYMGIEVALPQQR